MTAFNDVDKYIANFPEEVQFKLEEFRLFLQKLLPKATECINYGIPTYKVNEQNLVHFGGFKSHLGFYPGAAVMDIFENELSEYKSAKGSVQFPYNQAIPYDVIEKIVHFRIEQNDLKLKQKTLKICKKGHQFYKTSDCPTCPECEKNSKPKEGFMSKLASPARRALENAGIYSINQLSNYTENEIISLHGMGNNALEKIKAEMKNNNIIFKK